MGSGNTDQCQKGNVQWCGARALHVLYFKMDQWVTQGGTDPLPMEEEHCSAVEVTEEDIQNSVKFVPSLSAVVRNT